MKGLELRLHNVRLLCLACRTPLTIPGPWNGAVMADFRGQHRLPMLAGWTIADTCEHVTDVDIPVPPPVRDLP